MVGVQSMQSGQWRVLYCGKARLGFPPFFLPLAGGGAGLPRTAGGRDGQKSERNGRVNISFRYLFELNF
jgi:hypothetical protein